MDRDPPAYRRIADELAGEIRSGVYSPGDRLPSLTQAVTRWAVSVTTVRKAYETLAYQGLVEPVHGVGLFVAVGEPAASDLEVRVTRLERHVFGGTP